MLVSYLRKLFERERPGDRKVVFLHIPKTGGTTFRMVLRRFYPFYNRCKSPDFVQILKDLDNFQCIEFHVAKVGNQHFFSHKDIIQKPNWKYLKNRHIFVMFRNPVNRVVSSYFEWVRRSEQKHSREALERYLSLRGIHNLQTGFLLGIHPKSRKLLERNDVKLAKQVIHGLKINVGIMERYDESLHLLEVVTGKHIPDRIVRIENTTNKSLLAEVGNATRDFIQEHNSLDQELYEYAVELFEKQLRHAPAKKKSDFVYQFPEAP